jgi:hypothetical protein
MPLFNEFERIRYKDTKMRYLIIKIEIWCYFEHSGAFLRGVNNENYTHKGNDG